MLELLLKFSADPTRADNDGHRLALGLRSHIDAHKTCRMHCIRHTALHWAAATGNANAIPPLLAAGARLVQRSLCTRDGHPALDSSPLTLALLPAP